MVIFGTKHQCNNYSMLSMTTRFDPSEIKETIPQQARKQPETEMEQPFVDSVAFGVHKQLFDQSSPESTVQVLHMLLVTHCDN